MSTAPLQAIGLMTGTALDGNIDVALLRSDGVRITEFGPHALLPGPPELAPLLRRALAAAQAWDFRGAEPAIFAQAEEALTRAQAAAVRSFVAAQGMEMAQIGIVGFHGQTVLHRPPEPGRPGATRQLGDGRLLQRLLGCKVAWDFRSADVAAGGQGAPLAPVFHRALLQQFGPADLRPAEVAVLNLGGVGNLTWWSGIDSGPPREAAITPAPDPTSPTHAMHCGGSRDAAFAASAEAGCEGLSGSSTTLGARAQQGAPPPARSDTAADASIRTGRARHVEEREHPARAPTPALVAFDTGPANAPIDDWVRRHGAGVMDRDGSLARQGRVDEARLARLLAHPWFDLPPPKSLDRNAFTLEMAEGLSLADGAATLTAFSAAAVGRALDLLPQRPHRLIVCGGGRRNPALMEALARRSGAQPLAAEALGWHGDAIEAQCFAFLALRSLRGLPLSFPGTTGAPHPMPGGQVCG